MPRSLMGLLLAAVAVVPLWADERSALRDALALEAALQEAIRRAEPSVACVLVSRSDDYRKLAGAEPPGGDTPGRLGAFDPRQIPQAMAFDRRRNDDLRRRLDLAHPAHVPEAFGSGVVIDARGFILTNYHVVRDAAKVYVRLPGGVGSYVDVHAADPRSDLAVLRILDESVLPLRPIKLGDGAKVRKGQFVVALTHPFAAGFRDGEASASWGIVSNLRRRAPRKPGETQQEATQSDTLHHYGTLIQTDARLNLGCSGGALLDLHGEMVGLTTALAAIHGGETAGGYAVPMTEPLRRIVEKLRRGEEVEYGFLGVQVQDLGAPGAGVQVSGVTNGSPADEAGIRNGDVILSVNGHVIRESDDLFLALGVVQAGNEARIEVRSGAQVATRTPRLAKFYVPGPVIVTNRPQPVRGLRVDYLSVWQMMQSRTSPFARMLTERQSLRGVFITEVQPGSSASSTQPIPLKVGEIVTQVNGKPVHTPAAFYREMQDAIRLKGVSTPIELTLATQNPQQPETKVTLP